MDYPNNDYSKQNQVFYDDETLLKEFSDPKEALDYDGDLVFFEDDVPPVNRGSIPPKKKGGKGMIFLIIAAVLLACSIAFAVIMILRTNGSNGSSESSGANSAASATSATQPDSGQDNVGTTASNDSAGPYVPSSAVEDTTEAMSLEDYYLSSDIQKTIDNIRISDISKKYHVEGNVLYIDLTFNSFDYSQRDTDNVNYDIIIAALKGTDDNLNNEIPHMRKATGIDDATIELRGFDKNEVQFYPE